MLYCPWATICIQMNGVLEAVTDHLKVHWPALHLPEASAAQLHGLLPLHSEIQ